MPLLARARRYGHRVDARRVPHELRNRHRQASVLRTGQAHRLDRFRHAVIPWMHRIRPLPGQRILEIGCGEGVSTVALAEQGAAVTAVDLSEELLAPARATCQAYGLSVEFVAANATEMSRFSEPGAFDQIVFWACLEHMGVSERLVALRSAWDALAPGGLLTVVETPNRLWYHDSHTSGLPFFDWLPADLAFRYRRFSPRIAGWYPDHTGDPDPDVLDRFERRGRGVSHHEFELALGDLRHLEVAGCLQLDRRRRRPLLRAGWRLSREGRYQGLLAGIAPSVPTAFLQPFLYLTLRRP